MDRDCELGIIEEVPVGVPTKWQSRMFVVAKKSGKPRRMVDLSPLNKHCLRDTHSNETVFNQVSKTKNKTWWTPGTATTLWSWMRSPGT